ncbi:MAG: ATP-binding protein [Pseudomonadota bacterium]
MYERTLQRAVFEALADTPAVFVQGARQVGKTTLVRDLGVRPAAGAPGRRYLSLDDANVLAAASADPAGFLAALREPVVLDEVQRVPALALTLKAEIDRDRRPGRFLLTGSARLLTVPQLSEALVGRMELLTLWPLSQREISGGRSNLVDRLFAGEVAEAREPAPRDLWASLIAGGFPEALARSSPERRRRWFESYLTTLLQREVRELSRIEDLAALPRLLALCAARTAQTVNVADLSRDSGIPQTTLHRYLALLEGVFLIHFLPAWSANLGKRLVRAPKLHLVDSGLAAHLLGVGGEPAGTIRGSLFESFVVNEILRLRDLSAGRPVAFHFRVHGGREVDLVLEDRAGRLVGIEVKAAATVTGRDFGGLRTLQEAVPERFLAGAVIYTGPEVLPFGQDLYAVPVSALWV